jgi:hypothetical protein
MAAQHGIDCARCEEKRIDVIIRVGPGSGRSLENF